MNKKRIERSVLKKIKSGEVKMRPKWWFEVINTSTKILWIGILIVATIAAMTIRNFLEVYNPRELADLGEVGRELLFEDFPYGWLILGVAGIMGAVVVMNKIGTNYRRNTLLKLIIVIIIFGILIATATILGRFY